MKVRALISFTGTFSMARGEVREISDLAIAENLKKVGYVEEIGGKVEKKAEQKAEKTEDAPEEKVTEKKRSPRRKKDGN